MRVGRRSVRHFSLRRRLKTEHSQDAVAHVVIDHATVPLNDGSDLAVISIERMNHVIRQQAFGKRSEATDIDKKNSQRFLLASCVDARLAQFFLDKCCILLIANEPSYGHGSDETRLASEPNVGIKLQTSGEQLLGLGSWPAIFDPFQNNHPTSRTTRIPAT